MKKINIIITSLIFAGALVSCEDMLETDSSRQVFDPTLDEKTDSIFYTVGILQAMQQLADQYVLTNEMKGDLVTTNTSTETALRELADFSATTSNEYDSAYVYYRVINNCNYYIAYRDTTLTTGSKLVTMDEYAEAKAIRAWAYLQLARTYGTVPFYTKPLTSVADVNSVTETKDIKGICDALAPDLAQYSGYALPDYGDIACGTNNWGTSKTIQSIKCMIPVDVILGDLYLESNQYELAANYYFTYLKNNALASLYYYESPYSASFYTGYKSLPNDLSSTPTTSADDIYLWDDIFSQSDPDDIITYIPMAVNKLKGKTTDLPALFGYNYYSTSSGSVYNTDREIEPSDTYYDLCNSQEYYYVPEGSSNNSSVSTLDIGDMRRYAMVGSETEDDSTYTVIIKYQGANIYLYRGTTVYMHLAEAVNRMGYPDAAFAILKDGINESLLTDTTYISDDTKTLLTTTLPFLSSANTSTFGEGYGGIHAHGSGYTEGSFSPYQMSTIVGQKMSDIADEYGVTIGTTKADTINAVEDLICDEYALEFAFEGSRFSDLCRLARHKNDAGTYGSNFGGEWLAKKLAYKSPVVDLTEESNWYLPLK